MTSSSPKSRPGWSGRLGVLDATRPIGRRPLLTPPEVRRASRGNTFVDVRGVPGLDEPARLLGLPIDRGGRRLVLVVGATRENRAEALRSLRTELLVAGPFALVLATALGYLLAGAGLRAVEAMRRRAAAISADRPGGRLPVPPTGDELERLGTTLNGMLARLEAALERERGFVAEAGHELRTPLALLRAEIELALDQPREKNELEGALRSAADEVDRLSQLAEHLLLLARLDRGALRIRTASAELTDVFESLAARFEQRARAAGRHIHADSGTHLLAVDRVRLEQALANLIENALRHGNGDIRLYAVEVGNAIELHVADHGPGFPPGFLHHAFDRFSRADNARGGSGAGLGLAIVAEIAAAHGGTAAAANRPEGGADVWLSIPLAHSRPQQTRSVTTASR